MSAGPVSSLWRRFLRFSVRGLIGLVLMIGIWISWIVRIAHIQRDAVAAITKAGGNVSYDWEWKNGNSVVSGNAPAPKWLADVIGVDHFGHVTRVRFLGLWTGTDTVTAQVGRLTQLEKLSLVISALSDRELAHLKGLRNLTSLDLIHADELTDAGLPHLKALTNLSELNLSGNQVTDAGLAHLRGLTKFSVLSLRNTQVTDAGLAHLKGLVNLASLDLHNTLVTDAGLAHLKGLPKLSKLYLGNTWVTDAGMTELRQALPSLTIYR